MEVIYNFNKRIGTGKRSQSLNTSQVGPGQYTISSRLGWGPKYTMSSKSGAFDPSKATCSPGPGNYDPTPKFTNISYSMRIRPNSSKPNFMPGVGNYNLRTERSLVVPSYKYFN